jgi:hypothetical protein
MGEFDDLIPAKGNFDDLIPKGEEPSFLSKIGTGMSEMAKSESEGGRAAGETSLSFVTGMGGAILAPVAQGLTRLTGQGERGTAEYAKKVKDTTADIFTYQPKSEAAKKTLEALSPYISLPAILGNILERDPQTAEDFGKGLPLNADKVTSAMATALRDAGEPLRYALSQYGLGGGTAEDLSKTALEFYGYGKVGKVKDVAVKGARFIKDRTSLGSLKDVVKESGGDHSITTGTFDDLIPKKEAVKETTGSFDDLIPKESENAPIQEVPPEVKLEPQAKPEIVEPEQSLQGIEGELKPHRTAQRVEAESISRELMGREGLGEDIAKYEVEKGMMDTQARLGVEIMDKDYASAVKMAMGEIPAPEGVRPGTMITSVSKRAFEKGDYETVYKLGTTPEAYTVAKEIAKDLKSFDQGLSNNPITAIHSIVKARQEEIAKTGQKIDPVKQNTEIERLNKALQETQKALDEHIAKTAKTPNTYGSKNKLVTQSEYLKVKEELRAQLSSQVSAGLDPTIAAKLGKIGAYHLEAGARSFKVWSERVIEDVGAWVKPHLEDLWNQSNDSVGTKLKRYKTRLSNETAKITGKLENLDFAKQEKQPTKLDHEGRKLKDIRDRAKVAYDTAVRKTGTVTREEAAQLLDLAKVAAELKSKHDPSVAAHHGFPSEKDRLDYGRAQVAFERYVAALKEGDQSLATLAKNRVAEFKTTAKENPAKAVKDLAIDSVGEISDSSIALVASLDNSFVGRQGLLTLQTHPTVWAKSAAKSFGDIYKALRDKHGNEVAKDILHADLVSRENYINGYYHNAGILAKFEEQYPTSHPSRVPYLGRAFKASEVAFTNTALRMRIGTFDLLLDMAKKQDLPINKALVEDIGTIVNSATARAKTHDSKIVKNLLWAPKMMVANYNVLTGHTLGAGLKTSFARKQAAYNWMKMVGETAAVVAVLNALKPDSVEINPISSDFMKYRDGNTRIDLTAGRGQYVTLTARWLTGQTKNAQTKIIKDLDSGGFGERTYFDVGMDFLTNKTTPLVRQGISIAKSRNFEGKKPTAGSIAADLTVAIPVSNFYDNLWSDYPDKSSTALIGSVADVFGVNANTYQTLEQWDNNKSDRMKRFKQRVGDKMFKKMNIAYNKKVNASIDSMVKTEAYQRLDDEGKQKVIDKIKDDMKRAILGKK